MVRVDFKVVMFIDVYEILFCVEEDQQCKMFIFIVLKVEFYYIDFI